MLTPLINAFLESICYDPPLFFSSPSTVTIMPAVPAPALPVPPQHVHHLTPAPILPAFTLQTSHSTTICPQDYSPQPMEDQQAELQCTEMELSHGAVLPQLDTRDETLQ